MVVLDKRSLTFVDSKRDKPQFFVSDQNLERLNRFSPMQIVQLKSK